MKLSLTTIIVALLAAPVIAQAGGELSPAEEKFVLEYLEATKEAARRMPTPDSEDLWVVRESADRGSHEWVEATRRIGFNVLGRERSDWDTAVDLLEEAFEFEPDNPSILEDLGRAYIFVGRREDGLRLLESSSGRAGARFLDAFRSAGV